MPGRTTEPDEAVAAEALVEALRTLHQDDPAPVYVQIERRIRMGVADGTLQPGDHLPSVRDLARQQDSLHAHQRSLGEYQEALARAERLLRESQAKLREVTGGRYG